MTEFIEIKKRERSPLRIGRAGDPDRELLRLELFDLRRRPGGKFVLFKIEIFGLQALLAYFKTAPSRVAEKPESIAGRFAAGSLLGRVAESCVKNFLRLRRIAEHQETKAVKLEQILFFFGHADRLFPKGAMLRAPRRSQRKDVDLTRSFLGVARLLRRSRGY